MSNEHGSSPEHVTPAHQLAKPLRAKGEQVGDEESEPAARKPNRFPLSIPRARPARLDAYEADLVGRVKDLIDAIWELDQTIEEAAGLVGELMGDEMRKVGVEWRPHSSRAGLHPAAFRTRRGQVHGVPYLNTADRPSAGQEGRLLRRFFVEHINPPRGLAWYARGKAADSGSEAIRKEQLEALALLQLLLDVRAGAIDPLGSLATRGAGWKRQHAAFLGFQGQPPVRGGYSGLVADIKQRTIDMRLNMVAIRKWNWVKARQAAALNEADNESRDADKKS